MGSPFDVDRTGAMMTPGARKCFKSNIAVSVANISASDRPWCEGYRGLEGEVKPTYGDV